VSLHGHGFWLLSRAAGIVALLAMTAAVICGLLLANRLAGRKVRLVAALHQHLSLAALVAMVVHGEALLGDPWLKPGLTGLMLPFSMAYRPLWTGLGIIAGWVAVVLGLSYYVRRHFGPRRWRQLHRFIAVAWVLAVVHTLGAGTDGAAAALRIPVLTSAGVVAALLSVRLLGRRSGSRTSSRPTRTASARSPG
jgi:sulfoxide reductase heme-binding subunit YedZ